MFGQNLSKCRGLDWQQFSIDFPQPAGSELVQYLTVIVEEGHYFIVMIVKKIKMRVIAYKY
jgi:hypothetical protein